ncbi:MAG: DUF2029 domain-containing protein [Dehalococcoidia bacterium]|nr:DUF2029 domain-containing protein [Dehalococcoidia bacterium]
MAGYQKWLVIGLILRLLLIPTTTYGDLHAIAYALHLLPFEGETDIYQRLREINVETSPVPSLGTDFYTYPPLSYFFFGGIMGLLRPLYTDTFSTAIASTQAVFVTYPQIFLWLTLYKLPFLPFDLGAAFVVAKFFDDPRSKVRAFALWMLNPAPIIAGYLFGQFDVVPALLVLLSFLEFKRSHPWRAAFLMGVGACFKTYPLMLLPVLAIVATRTWWKRGLFVLAGLAPFVLSLQLLRGSPAALDVIFNSNPAQRIFQSTITLGYALDMTGYVYVFVLFYCIVLLHGWFRTKGDLEDLLRYSLAVLLLAFAFSFSHLQWLTWSVPLIILDWVRNPRNQVIHLTLLGTAILASLTWQFGPPQEFLAAFGPKCDIPKSCPSFSEFLAYYMEPVHFANIMRSIFAGATLYWVYISIFKVERREVINGQDPT